jgi:glycosyltransferase involved in cell wall biosynthesis
MTGSVQMPTLRVVHIISGLGQGGAETVLYRLVTSTQSQAHHVVISLGDQDVFGPRLREAGITVHCLNMNRSVPQLLRGLWKLPGLIRQLQPDVVQTWMYNADFIGGLTARLAGVRAVAWGIRNSGANLASGSRLARILSWVCARLSCQVPGVIVACASNAAQRHQRWGYCADRMLVIPNGYDLNQWQPDTTQRAQARALWGVSEDTPVIGCVARWNPLKDHATLLQALALSVKATPKLRCVLVGQGMDDGNAELMALIQRYHLREHILLMGRRDDVPALMNGLDLYVLSSRAEGFPNVVAEAMATGVPCVVTDVGDAAAMVGDTGWVVPPENPPELAHALDSALAGVGTAHYNDRAQRARSKVQSLYSVQAMGQSYLAVWRRLAADYPARFKRPALAGPRPKRLVFLVTNPAFFLSHRLPLALRAREAGYDVHIATRGWPQLPDIMRHGFAHHTVPISRSGRNPLQDLYSIFALWRLFRRLRPDAVHAVTIKSVLYGGIAARLARVPGYVAAVSGLGFIFTRQQRFDILRSLVVVLYRLALGHGNSRVIFQNTGDRDVLQSAGVVRAGQCVLIRGSGVDLDQFKAEPEPPGPPVALFVARLLMDKGLAELVEAARMTKGDATGLRWVVAGSPDPGNPASVPPDLFEQWQREGTITWLGERADIAALYANAHIAVLPSYREGLPKSLVEAAACGRAVVTTDVPGCRDAIEAGETGVLVPVRNARALADAVLALARDAGQRQAMGRAGRQLAEREFDIHKVANAHLAVYDALTGRI